MPVPSEFLTGISTLLNSKAILILSTPNYSGLVAKLLGKRDPFLTPPEHLNFFTYKGLAKIVVQIRLEGGSDRDVWHADSIRDGARHRQASSEHFAVIARPLIPGHSFRF